MEIVERRESCGVMKPCVTGVVSPGGHSARMHTGGQSHKISGNPNIQYHFSFIATQKYQLILYFHTSKQT